MNWPLLWISGLGLAFFTGAALLFMGPQTLVYAVTFPVVGVVGVGATALVWDRLTRWLNGHRY